MNQGATQEFLSVEVVPDDHISVKDTRVFAGMTNEKKNQTSMERNYATSNRFDLMHTQKL